MFYKKVSSKKFRKNRRKTLDPNIKETPAEVVLGEFKNFLGTAILQLFLTPRVIANVDYFSKATL